MVLIYSFVNSNFNISMYVLLLVNFSKNMVHTSGIFLMHIYPCSLIFIWAEIELYLYMVAVMIEISTYQLWYSQNLALNLPFVYLNSANNGLLIFLVYPLSKLSNAAFKLGFQEALYTIFSSTGLSWQIIYFFKVWEYFYQLC